MVGAQLKLLEDPEPSGQERWRELPEESRRAITELFGRLVIEYAAWMAGEVSDDR
jgi:hypothetical protein